MIKQGELDQQKLDAAKEKLIYSPPTLIVFGPAKEVVKGGSTGVSEHICGCGIGS